MARRQAPPARLLVVAALFCASVTGIRNMPLFALTAAPLLAENVSRLSWRPSCPSAVKGAAALLLLTLGLLVASGDYYRFTGSGERFGLGFEEGLYPAGLPDFLRRSGFTGQLYHPNELGGFFLYHGILPLTDGRWEVYDQGVYERIRVAPRAPASWEWLIRTYDIRGVVLLRGQNRTTAALYALLKKDDAFHLAYYDPVCTFWVRTDGFLNRKSEEVLP